MERAMLSAPPMRALPTSAPGRQWGASGVEAGETQVTGAVEQPEGQPTNATISICYEEVRRQNYA